MKKIILSILVSFIVPVLYAQENPRIYHILDSDSSEVSFSDMIVAASKADIILFGELHTNPVAHWLEYKMLEALPSEGLTLGMEQFETDVQEVVDEYLSGLISRRSFESEARVWPNYNNDYSALVEYARENKIPLLATNIPRRYAASVGRGGCCVLDSFPETARKFMPPLPFVYKPGSRDGELSSMMSAMGGGRRYMLEAQGLKDASMAWQISRVSGKVIHINGRAHSDGGEGIVKYLEEYCPGRSVMIVSVMTSDEDLDCSVADFVIVVSQDFH